MAVGIVFTHHAVERKAERGDYLVQTATYGETRKAEPALENLLRSKGRWHCRWEKSEKLIQFYCIVNNLEVYCGVYIEEDKLILITTYWPYTSKMKRKMFPKRRENYAAIDIDSFNPEDHMPLRKERTPEQDFDSFFG